VPRMGTWDTADLAELKAWVEGLRVAAHKARGKGHITLADALDLTHLEVYMSYVDEDSPATKPSGLTETSRPAELLSRSTVHSCKR
jgi:hypothetical protein